MSFRSPLRTACTLVGALALTLTMAEPAAGQIQKPKNAVKDLNGWVAFYDADTVRIGLVRPNWTLRIGEEVICVVKGPLTDQLIGRHRTRDDVIGQNLHKLVFVFGLEQRFNRSFGQGGKGVIGRREDGERSITLQRVDQSGGLNGCDQGREVVIAGRDIDDVVSAIHRRARGCDCEGGRTGHRF